MAGARVRDCITRATQAALRIAPGAAVDAKPELLELWEHWQNWEQSFDAMATEMVSDPADIVTLKETFRKYFSDDESWAQLPEDKLRLFLTKQLDRFIDVLEANTLRDGEAAYIWARDFAPYLKRVQHDPILLQRLARSYLVRDWAGKVVTPKNLDERVVSIRGELLAKLDGFMAAVGNGLYGAATERIVADAVAEVVDGRVSSPAARALRDMFDHMHERLNLRGAMIEYHEGWAPQAHSAEKLLDGEDAWVEYHMQDGVLHWGRILHPLTDEPYQPGPERERFLRGVYQNLRFKPTRTGSEADTAETTLGSVLERHKPLSERLGAERRLIYANAAARRAALERWGEGNELERIFQHIHRHAVYEAILEVFGPVPERTISKLGKTIKDAVIKGNTYAPKELTPGMLERVAMPVPKPERFSKEWWKQHTVFWPDRTARAFAEQNAGLSSSWTRIYDEITGMAALPPAERYGIANTTQSVLNAAYGTYLGGTLFAQFADLGVVAMGQRMLRSGPYKTIAKVWGEFLTGNAHDRDALARRLHISEQLVGTMWHQVMADGGPSGARWTRAYSDAVHHLGGARRWQASLNAVVGLELPSKLTDLRGVEFEQLPGEIRELLRQSDVHAVHWNLWREAEPVYVGSGATLITPEAVRAHHKRVNPRLLDETIQRFEDMATFWQRVLRPEPDARTRATLRGGTRPGTILGTGLDLVMFLKTFPATMALQHLNMLVRNPLARMHGVPRHIALAAEFLAVGTVFGALGLSAFNLTRGRVPGTPDPTTEEGRQFIWECVLRSGGLSLLGDTMMAAEAQGAQGIFSYIAGPLVALVARGGATAVQVASGTKELEPALAQGWQLLREVAPGRTYWPTALLYERLALDQITNWFSTAPDYYRRAEKRAEKTGSWYYWEPGEATPEVLQ